MALLLALASAARGAAAPLPRALTAESGSFAGSGAPVLLVGANIVVKVNKSPAPASYLSYSYASPCLSA